MGKKYWEEQKPQPQQKQNLTNATTQREARDVPKKPVSVAVKPVPQGKVIYSGEVKAPHSNFPYFISKTNAFGL